MNPRIVWDPPEPQDAVFVALVRREVADARRRALSLVPTNSKQPLARVVVQSVPEPVRAPQPVVPQRSLWPRSKIIAALWLWAAAHDGRPPTSIDWRLTADDHPSFNRVVKEFGLWSDGIEAAGFARPLSGRVEAARVFSAPVAQSRAPAI